MMLPLLCSVALLPALPDVFLRVPREVEVQNPCATSAWGPWPLLTTRHPSQKLQAENKVRPLFLLYGFLCFVVPLFTGFGVLSSGIFGSVGLGIPVFATGRWG